MGLFGSMLYQIRACAGHLILGNLAYDLLDLDLEEALEHHTQVGQEAPEGSRDWITAQQIAFATLAQLGVPPRRDPLAQ